MKRKARIISFILSLVMIISGVSAFNMMTAFGKEHEKSDRIEVIKEYIKYLDNGHVEKIVSLLYSEKRAEYDEFILDEENRVGHIGLFNYKSAKLVSVKEYEGSYEELGCTDIYEGISQISALECIIDVKTYGDSNYLTTGENRFVFILGLNEESEYVILEIIRDRLWSEGVREVTSSDISTFSYDAPVSAPASGTWKTPSTINVQSYGTVDFKNYCYVVTVNEFGTDSYNENARKAVALSVKNYGWNRTLVQKYPNLGYDVKPTTADQVYNPSKTVTTKVKNAVDGIWNYVMLSCDNKLFCSFFVKNSGVNSYARHNGGVLSQDEANSLGNSGYSWEYILHYFYDYGQYNGEMTSGVIKIVSLSHTQTGTYVYDTNSHWIVCTTCGCIHVKSRHNWVAATGGGYVCSTCKATKLSVVNYTICDTIYKVE